eukprot:3134190-Amphidinium_carterae.1
MLRKAGQEKSQFCASGKDFILACQKKGCKEVLLKPFGRQFLTDMNSMPSEEASKDNPMTNWMG